MNAAKLIPALGCVLALSACAGGNYDKLRADAEPWETADGACKAYATSTVPAQPLRAIMMRHAYDGCMQNRGWKVADYPFSPALRHIRR